MSTREALHWVVGLEAVTMADISQVGGKNAALGEMIQHVSEAGVSVPGGFAVTTHAFWAFIEENDLHNIFDCLNQLDVNETEALAYAGRNIRERICSGRLPHAVEAAIRQAFTQLTHDDPTVSVAVRSSATAEDLPEASFAGQQESFLNITSIDAVLSAIRQVYASLFTDRAIAYRTHQGFAHHTVALSVGVQKMVRCDDATSGVMFTLDTESGCTDVVLITASYGMGELVVQGRVNPDEFIVYKPNIQTDKPCILRRRLGHKREKLIGQQTSSYEHSVRAVAVQAQQQQQFCLDDLTIRELAKLALAIEVHYAQPMDIEWAIDAAGDIFILQARPETVKRSTCPHTLERYQLDDEKATVLVQGSAVGEAIAAGQVRHVAAPNNIHEVQFGDILVTDMTDPDWEPIMKKASAIVTNRGGRTCHAAIIAREMGIPAVVGCQDATELLPPGMTVTVSCAQGSTGWVYQGDVAYTKTTLNIEHLPKPPCNMMINVANPERAFSFARLPCAGVGLARIEFIISRLIGVHPKAVLNLAQCTRQEQARIADLSCAYATPVSFYIETLVEAIATLAAAFFPRRIVLRLSDFKSNEYANLIGGVHFEPNEENPMLGFRGAARYVSSEFSECFALECEAVRRVYYDMGLNNIDIMIPFVRNEAEAKAVLAQCATCGLVRGSAGLRFIMMCELPCNALLAEQFLQYFDGFSIGSNDMTQLTLGCDRDSALVADQFDERDPAVKCLFAMAIAACKTQGKTIGICGQGPSDYPEFAHWLVEQGIDSLSLNPDTVIETWLSLTTDPY